MGKGIVIKNLSAVFITLLFVTSLITPLTNGTNTQGSDVNPYIELDESIIEKINLNYCEKSEITTNDSSEINRFDVQLTNSLTSFENVTLLYKSYVIFSYLLQK